MCLNETYGRIRVGKHLPDICLEVFRATEFNEFFSDRQPRRNVNVFRSVGKPSHLEASVCPRKLHWICLTYFLLRIVWRKEMLYRLCFSTLF